MGQFLIVQGPDARAVREVWDRGVALFEAVHRLRPDGAADAVTTRVARFPRRLVPAPGLVREDTPKEWGVAAGAFVSSEGVASGATLRRIATALVDDGEPLAAVARGLDGYFVLAAGSERTGDMAVMTDRCGALHAYHARTSDCAVVSTSALVLAALTGASLDPTAARELLAAHSVFEERSLWLGVSKIPDATIVRFRDGRVVSRRRWWTPADHCHGRAPRAATPAELADALTASVETLLQSHPRACFDLTGGFDSRILVGAALRTGLPFATVVNGRQDDENVAAACRIAAKFGLDHRNQVPGRHFPFPEMRHFEDACALGDGEANVLDYAPTMLAHTNLAKSFDLAVNGSFGEVCRGYWWDVLGARLWSRGRFDARKVAVARFASEAWCERITRGTGAPSAADHFTGVVERATADLAGLPDVALVDAVYLRVRMQRWHGRIASLVSRLRPTAAPFAFRGPLELALSMTPATRWAGRVARRVVEHLDPQLAAMPLANGAPASPLRLSNLHRQGPYVAELTGRAVRAGRRALRVPAAAAAPKVWRAGDVWRLPEMSDVLRVPTMLTRDLYDQDAVRALVEGCRSDRAAPAATLGRILTIELAARAAEAARTAVPVAVR